MAIKTDGANWSLFITELKQEMLKPGRVLPGLDVMPIWHMLVSAWASDKQPLIGDACKAVCKRLGIKPTYKAINEFLS